MFLSSLLVARALASDGVLALPVGDDPERWRQAAALAEIDIGACSGPARCVSLEHKPSGWSLEMHAPGRAARVLLVRSPASERDREEIASLAASLLDELAQPAVPASAPVTVTQSAGRRVPTGDRAVPATAPAPPKASLGPRPAAATPDTPMPDTAMPTPAQPPDPAGPSLASDSVATPPRPYGSDAPPDPARAPATTPARMTSMDPDPGDGSAPGVGEALAAVVVEETPGPLDPGTGPTPGVTSLRDGRGDGLTEGTVPAEPERTSPDPTVANRGPAPSAALPATASAPLSADAAAGATRGTKPALTGWLDLSALVAWRAAAEAGGGVAAGGGIRLRSFDLGARITWSGPRAVAVSDSTMTIAETDLALTARWLPRTKVAPLASASVGAALRTYDNGSATATRRNVGFIAFQLGASYQVVDQLALVPFVSAQVDLATPRGTPFVGAWDLGAGVSFLGRIP